MKNGSILIISDNEQVGNNLVNKIKLLRECDEVQLVSYIEAISVLNSTQPVLILVYSSNAASVGIIKEIRTLKALDKVPIILVMDNFIEDLILYAFDNGADDFCLINDPDSIILMRVILSLQKAILYRQIDFYNEMLSIEGIIDKNSGIFTKDVAPFIMKTFFSKSIEENMKDTVFMCVEPVLKKQSKLAGQNLTQNIESLIKRIPRENDIIAYGEYSFLYIILFNSGMSGAKSVVQRIQNILSNEYQVYATAAEVTASFEEMEPILTQSLKDQINRGIEFNFLQTLNINESKEVMDIEDETGKTFKDFKQEFYSGFEKMVAPVFYHVQSQVLNSFPKSKVSFDITETQSRFTISEDEVKSELCITYPSYVKLLMDIKHTARSNNPKIQRLTFDFEDFSSEKLLSVLQDIIKEFAIQLNTKENKNE